MKSLPVRPTTPRATYRIEFGDSEKALVRRLKNLRLLSPVVMVVTSASVRKARHVGALVKQLKGANSNVFVNPLPDGESQKNAAMLMKLYRAALKAGMDRKSLVIAMGGGVVTDLAGYFAATYMRGISYVSLPTTLLGMVDAAIGGKTGVDLLEGKNLIGAFWQPRLVWINLNYLKTLPKREWHTGFAEVIKYGIIKDRAFFEWLTARIKRKPDIRSWSKSDVLKAIHRSAQIKAGVVSADVRDTPLKGKREILNFGHTIGHALEAATDYRKLSHGQAISIGMVAAGKLALRLGVWEEDAQLQLLSLLQAVGLPTRMPASVRWPRFWSALQSDKKHVSGRLRFVLPIRIGRVEVKSGIPLALVKTVVNDMRS
ncbi:MAG: 3-dehydroquinate synthase [Elusimicrobia bacterium]|nr:3-dehydroquinate synthase [Candidatus Obscuribacterium magneticum]